MQWDIMGYMKYCNGFVSKIMGEPQKLSLGAELCHGVCLSRPIL